MRIGIPKEIKSGEHRIAATPALAGELAAAGHDVAVERSAGTGAGFADDDYVKAGARIVAGAAEAWGAELVMKVKEPLAAEFVFLREGLILYGYLHLAAERALTERLMASGTTAIAMETIGLGGRMPLLEPMSRIAGRMSVTAGAYHLNRALGGSGTLLSGAPGVAPGHVAVLGAGMAGASAARIAAGLGAELTILDVNVERLAELEERFAGRMRTLVSNRGALEDLVPRVDLLIGAVLVPGAKAPRIVTRAMLERMRPGSVLVDIAIDQGGCAETSRPTTHAEPVFTEAGVLHYCVPNMPSAYARTSTQALSAASAPYIKALAGEGLKALERIPGFAAGLNVSDGKILCAPVAEAHGLADGR